MTPFFLVIQCFLYTIANCINLWWYLTNILACLSIIFHPWKILPTFFLLLVGNINGDNKLLILSDIVSDYRIVYSLEYIIRWYFPFEDERGQEIICFLMKNKGVSLENIFYQKLNSILWTLWSLDDAFSIFSLLTTSWKLYIFP